MKIPFRTRAIALALCLAMVIGFFPNPITAFSVGTESNTGSVVGAVGVIGAENLNLYAGPDGTSGEGLVVADLSIMPAQVVIVDIYVGTENTWYKLDAAPGYAWPEVYDAYRWTYAYSIDILSSSGTTSIFDASGNEVTSVALPMYSKTKLNAESSLTGTVKYQWQICYDVENDLWVDIYGEDEATINLSFGMVCTLMDEANTVKIRCESVSGSKFNTSAEIPVTVIFTAPESPSEPDPTVPTEPVVQGYANITVDGVEAVETTIEYDDYTKYDQPIENGTKTLGVNTSLEGELTYSWQARIDGAADGEWEELGTGSTFALSRYVLNGYFAAASVGYNAFMRIVVTCGETVIESDELVITINERNPELYEGTVIEGDVTTSSGESVTVSVSGNVPETATLTMSDASDTTTIPDVDSSEIALALEVSITQDGAQWQPAAGERVAVSIPVEQLGLQNGDYFAVYHIHDGETEILGPFRCEDGYATFVIDGFSVVAISTNYGAAIGGVAEFAGSSVILDVSPVSFAGMTVWVADANLPAKVVIKNYTFDEYLGKLFYEIDAAPGYTWPEEYSELHWCYSDALKNINVNGEAGVYDESGNLVENVTVSTTETVTVNAETSLQSADISYKWQICYDTANNLWVDITGETDAQITITAGMIVSLMDDQNQAKVRCVTTAGSKTIISNPVVVTISIPEQDDEQEPYLEILIDNEVKDSVDVNDADKNYFASVLSADTNLSGSLTYQWDVLYDTEYMIWKTLGETETFSPGFSAATEGVYLGSYYIHFVDQTTSAVTIRLTVTDGVTSLTDTFVINLKYEAEEDSVDPASGSMSSSSDSGEDNASTESTTDPAEYGIATVDESGETTTKYNVIINYMNEDGTATVSDPYTSTVSPATELRVTVSFPTVVGYLPHVYNQTTGTWVRQDTYTFDGTPFTEDFILEVRYLPGRVEYKVNIYTQNPENDEYVLMTSFVDYEKTGTVLNEIKFPINGYYQSKFTSTSASVAADGSTVFNLYYDRIYYLMKFDLDGGYGVQPIYARHGVKLDIATPKKAGYIFVGWDQTEGTPAVDGELLDDGIMNSMYTHMPIGNTSYKAIWKAVDNAKVTIVYWGENPNDEGYSYKESVEFYAKVGTTLTFGADQLVCTLSEHTHGTTCIYQCGKLEHTHDINNNCYALTCTISTHNHVEAGCGLTNCSYASHVHNTSCYKAERGSIVQTSAPDIDNLDNWTSLDDGIYTYTTTETFIFITYQETHYLVKIGDVWYCSSEGDENDISLSCTHTHTDDCYDCGKIANSHVHTLANGCYKLVCTTEAHTHSAGCYSCIAHAHTNSCYLKTPDGEEYDPNLWTLVKSDEVTVAADGSTVMNVYYDRTTFTYNFYKEDTGDYWGSITDKWGANIYSRWTDICETAGNVYNWTVNSDGSGPWTSYIGVMGTSNMNYYSHDASGTSTAYYYFQRLDGTYPEDYSDAKNPLAVPAEGTRLSITKEDVVLFEGFTFVKGETSNKTFTSLDDAGGAYNGAKFYYSRNKYALDFNNGEDVVKTEIVMYQANLGSYDFTPAAPSTYEASSVEFAGWYQNPECTGEEYILSEHTMPSSNLILYAKWVPVKHNVTVYRYKDANGLHDLLCNHTDAAIGEMPALGAIPHGELLSKHYIPEEPTNGNYTFVTWAYYDEEKGEEVAVDINNFVVTKDVEIYAKWSSNVQIPYTIKYMIEGTTTEIAPATEGKHYAGETHTFNAKTAGQLNEGYQTGYFPTVPSHSIDFKAEDKSYEYTFYYVQKDAVPYTVYYVTEEPNGSGLDPVTLTVNDEEKTYYPLLESYTNAENRNAIVTENFRKVVGYMPDAYQKTLIIDGSEDATNQIIFVYSVNTTQAYYKVTHYTQNIDGKWFVHSTYENIGTIGDRYTEGAMDITGFTYAKTEYVVNDTVQTEDITTEGAKLTADGLSINLYYTRNKYPYLVQYINQADNTVLWEKTYNADSELKYYQDNATHIAPDYYGEGDVYERISAEELGVEIQVEKDPANVEKNIIKFFYKERQVTISYAVANGVGGMVNPSQEIVLISSGTAQGSTAEALPGYTFVGWFDINNKELSKELEFVPEKVDGLNVAATYYAKFEEQKVTIKYEVVGPAGCGTVDRASETIGAATGVAVGSTASVTDNTYKFVGWYTKDADGNYVEVTETDGTLVGNKFTPTKAENALWVDGTTYYAKFEYNLTSLTVQKEGWKTMDPNQTYIFNIKGNGLDMNVTVHGNGSTTIDGLTVGQQYTVTEITGWSWRYLFSGWSHLKNATDKQASTGNTNGATITIGLDGTITFTNKRSIFQWLDGDSWCDNWFGPAKNTTN